MSSNNINVAFPRIRTMRGNAHHLRRALRNQPDCVRQRHGLRCRQAGDGEQELAGGCQAFSAGGAARSGQPRPPELQMKIQGRVLADFEYFEPICVYPRLSAAPNCF